MKAKETKHLVTKESLMGLLTREDKEFAKRVIGRALVVLFERQTQAEQSDKQTKLTNGVGFTQADAKSGTLTALAFMKRGTLTDWQYDRWMKPGMKSGRPRIVKYWRQLDEAAQERAKTAKL